MKFWPNSSGFNGAIHYLWSNHKYEYTKYVYTSSSSILDDDNKWATSSSVIIDYSLSNTETSNVFCSNNKNKENISLYLFQNTLYLTHYSILTRNVLPNHYPRSWQLDGSNDNVTWTPIDSREKTNELNGANKKHTFQVKTPGKYRYFRINNTDFVWLYDGTISDDYFFFFVLQK